MQETEVKVGQLYIDKDWEDSIIRIKAINSNRSRIRYVFLQVKGKKIASSITWDISVESLHYIYKLYKDVEDINNTSGTI